jgi:hypothetical protein
VAHSIQHFTFEDAFWAASASKSLIQEIQEGGNESIINGTLRKPEVAVDVDQEVPSGHHILEIPQGAHQPHDEITAFGASWRGKSWNPGCYSGDSRYHKFVLSIIGDAPAYKAHGDGLKDLIEGVVAEASLVYEKQMKIRLMLASVTIYKDMYTAPKYAMWCPPNFMGQKLEQLSEAEIKFAGAVHILTGCGDGTGVVGEAFVGTACSKDGSNTAVVQLRGKSSWLTFAHELGHNFAAQHSFEDGMAKTGGIMDYGDGTLDGVYQFNSKYRKEEICSKLTMIGSCNGMFVPTSPPSHGRQPPTLPPAPTEAPAPSPKKGSRRRRRRSGGKGRRRRKPSSRRRRRRRRSKGGKKKTARRRRRSK